MIFASRPPVVAPGVEVIRSRSYLLDIISTLIRRVPKFSMEPNATQIGVPLRPIIRNTRKP